MDDGNQTNPKATDFDGPAHRFLVALDLMELGIELKRQSLRRQMPQEGEIAVGLALQQWLSNHR